MEDFRFRTEDIQRNEILKFFVETDNDRQVINHLKSLNPTLVEGSRGTGKSFLLRVAETELLNNFPNERIIPVYLSFIKSSLIFTDEPKQFEYWMLAKICAQVQRTVTKMGLGGIPGSSMKLLGSNVEISTFDQLISKFESSWKVSAAPIDLKALPSVDDFKNSIEDFCETNSIKRFSFLFDEVAHIFRPEQQKQFFSLFRDLRSPWISCNAAVYPGITSYGSTFQLAHDATLFRVNRDVLLRNYTESMNDIVAKQADSSILAAIARNKGNFGVLAYAVSGNPRLLLKTVSKCPKMNSTEVDSVIKEFYRNDIWSEHTSLSESFSSHKSLIDWGRDFIEKTVLPDLKVKNESRLAAGKSESTCYFWVHRDASLQVKYALKLLSYTGIVQELDNGIRGTRSELGTRYSVNLGTLLALESKPTITSPDIFKFLSIKRFSEFGANHAAFENLSEVSPEIKASELQLVFTQQLDSLIDVLDVTDWLKGQLTSHGLNKVGELLLLTEAELEAKVKGVGPVKAKKVLNAVMEFLAG